MEEGYDVPPTGSDEGPSKSLHFSPDGKKLLGYADHTINIWSLEDGKFLKRFDDDECRYIDSYNTPIFSPDGKTFAIYCKHPTDSSKTIKIIDSKNYRTQKVLNSGSVSMMVFSPSGNLLASSSGIDTIKIWNIESGKRIKELKVNGI